MYLFHSGGRRRLGQGFIPPPGLLASPDHTLVPSMYKSTWELNPSHKAPALHWAWASSHLPNTFSFSLSLLPHQSSDRLYFLPELEAPPEWFSKCLNCSPLLVCTGSRANLIMPLSCLKSAMALYYYPTFLHPPDFSPIAYAIFPLTTSLHVPSI